jgi:hypothetical protein
MSSLGVVAYGCIVGKLRPENFVLGRPLSRYWIWSRFQRSGQKTMPIFDRYFVQRFRWYMQRLEASWPLVVVLMLIAIIALSMIGAK